MDENDASKKRMKSWQGGGGMSRWEMRKDGEVRQMGRHGQWHACVGHPLTGAVRIGGNAGRSDYGSAGSETRAFVRSAEIIAMLVTMCRRKLN